jgi:hypothetical protein
MYHQKYYGNHEFAIDQGDLKLKNELNSSREKYILDFLFYKRLIDAKVHEVKKA